MACKICGSVNYLQKHHISYDPPQIIILCQDCHQKQHNDHGVGLSTFQVKPIPEDFSESWKTKKYNEIMEKYNISYATVWIWARKMKLKPKVIHGPINTMDKTLYSHDPNRGSATLRDRGQVTIPPRIIKALNLKKDEILLVDVRRSE